MAYASLREFIERLERAGRLVRVEEPGLAGAGDHRDPHPAAGRGGPAVLFEKVEGSSMPVLTNLFGTVERVAWGMNREPGELRQLGEMLAFLKQPEPPRGLRARRWRWRRWSRRRWPCGRRSRRPGAACQEVVLRGAEIDLGRLPIQTCWPGEPAPLDHLAAGGHQGPGRRPRADGFNLGIYRMQVTGRNTTLMRWLQHRGGAQHHRRWKAEKRRAAAGGGGDRRRSRHHPGGGDAGARTPCRSTSSRACCAAAGSSWSTASSMPLQGAGHRRDRARGPCQPRRPGRRGPLRRSHRLLQRGRAFPGVHHHGHDHAPPTRSISRPSPAGRRTSPRSWARRSTTSFCRCSSSSSRRWSISGCRPRAAPTGSRW